MEVSSDLKPLASESRSALINATQGWRVATIPLGLGL